MPHTFLYGVRIMNDELSILGTVFLENREKITVTGVNDVRSFEEDRIELDTTLGRLSIRGRGMKIVGMSSDVGDFTVVGHFNSFIYGSRNSEKKSIRERIFG